jgi:hypothetical protein
MEEEDDTDPIVVSIPMEYAEAMRVADLLAGYGNEEDENIAENIRYMAKTAKAERKPGPKKAKG